MCFHTTAFCDKFFFRQGRKSSVNNPPPIAHRVFDLMLRVRFFGVWTGSARLVIKKTPQARIEKELI